MCRPMGGNNLRFPNVSHRASGTQLVVDTYVGKAGPQLTSFQKSHVINVGSLADLLE